MMLTFRLLTRVLLGFILISPILLKSQSRQPLPSEIKANLDSIILEADSRFWAAYNSCDVEGMGTFLTPDVEFYHDKGGLTSSSATLLQQIKNGICKGGNSQLRREAMPGTVKVYPLESFGAILSGAHRFYLTENGKDERLVERAQFTHVWRYQDGNWKMPRVLSYDHQPDSENRDKQALMLSEEILQRYVGHYQAPNTGAVEVTIVKGLLQLKTAGPSFSIFPESETTFFVKEAPLKFEFILDENQKVSKFIVRENGEAVEEAE